MNKYAWDRLYKIFWKIWLCVKNTLSRNLRMYKKKPTKIAEIIIEFKPNSFKIDVINDFLKKLQILLKKNNLSYNVIINSFLVKKGMGSVSSSIYCDRNAKSPSKRAARGTAENELIGCFVQTFEILDIQMLTFEIIYDINNSDVIVKRINWPTVAPFLIILFFFTVFGGMQINRQLRSLAGNNNINNYSTIISNNYLSDNEKTTSNKVEVNKNWLWAGLSSFVAILFVLFLWLYMTSKQKIYAILAALSFGGFTFLSHPNFSLGGVTFKIDLPQNLNCNCISKNNINYKEISSIYPFEDGSDEIKPQIIKEKLKAIMNTMESNIKLGEIKSILLVGRADKRPLKECLRKKYESNVNLANARASVVKNILRGIVDPSKIIITIAGASNTGNDVSRNLMAMDRSVTIYALLAEPNRNIK